MNLHGVFWGVALLAKRTFLDAGRREGLTPQPPNDRQTAHCAHTLDELELHIGTECRRSGAGVAGDLLVATFTCYLIWAVSWAFGPLPAGQAYLGLHCQPGLSDLDGGLLPEVWPLTTRRYCP